MAYIDTVKRLLPLVEGLNKLFLVITKEGVKGFAEINQMFFNGEQAYEDGSDKLENCVTKLLDTFAAITGVHLDTHNSLEVLFKDRFADMDVGWVHQNQLVAEETSVEQSLFFEVLEEEENKSYTFEITMEIGDNIRHAKRVNRLPETKPRDKHLVAEELFRSPSWYLLPNRSKTFRPSWVC